MTTMTNTASSSTTVEPKRKGPRRIHMTKTVRVVNKDGNWVRATKGKPNSKMEAKFFSIPFDVKFKGGEAFDISRFTEVTAPVKSAK